MRFLARNVSDMLIGLGFILLVAVGCVITFGPIFYACATHAWPLLWAWITILTLAFALLLGKVIRS